MRNETFLAALAGLALATGAAAQSAPADPAPPARELPYDRGYDKPSARTDAVNAQEAPVTAALNDQSGAAAGTAATVDAANQAQYDADRSAYMAALVQHDAAVDRTDMRYARQQRAYADAMAVWRVQVDECKKGHQRACNLPTPNVTDYY